MCTIIRTVYSNSYHTIFEMEHTDNWMLTGYSRLCVCVSAVLSSETEYQSKVLGTQYTNIVTVNRSWKGIVDLLSVVYAFSIICIHALQSQSHIASKQVPPTLIRHTIGLIIRTEQHNRRELSMHIHTWIHQLMCDVMIQCMFVLYI